MRVGLSLAEDERELVLVGFERPDGGVAIVVLNRSIGKSFYGCIFLRF